MASYRRAAWYLCWWGCLFGVLQVAHGAERISVPLPSVQDLLNRANPVINENSLGYVQAHDSAFQYQQRSYSAPIKQSIKIPSSAIKDAAKGALKSNAAAVVMNAAMAASVAAVGWVIDEAGQPVKKKAADAQDAAEGSCSSTNSCWVWLGQPSNITNISPVATCKAVVSSKGNGNWSYTRFVQTNNGGDCYAFGQEENGEYVFTTIQHNGQGCAAAGQTYSDSKLICTGAATAPLVDSDYNSLTDFIDGQSASFRADLAKAACEGSLAPARCYQALQDAASFLNSGPSSIQGPKSTTTTTTKNADGTVSTGTTTKDTKFDMKYDGTGGTATPSTTTTTTDGKGGESTSTDKEDEDSNSGTAPKDEDKETASPCTTNCDGPAYKDLYTKTDVTKEGVLDTYAAKVKALPIMSAVGNFFTVNGGGSCPVWSGTIDIGWGQSVTLSNDFACQPWFTALSPAFHAVLMLVAAWLAFRVSILD